MRQISDHVARAELAEAIINYAYDGTTYSGKKEIVKVLMATISQSINYKKQQCENNQKNGSKGGNPLLKGVVAKSSDNRKDNQADNRGNNQPDNPVKEKDIDIVPANAGIKKEKEKKKKVKDDILPIPTIEEVEEYIKAKGYTIDARAFWAYYDAREWTKDGKPIKNWHLQIATWVKNSNNYDNRPRQQAGTVDMFSDAEREAAMRRIDAVKAEAGRRQAEKERREREEAERQRIERLNRLTGFDYQPNNNNNDE